MASNTLNEPVVTCQDAVGVLENIRATLMSQDNHQLQVVVRDHPEIGSILRDICGKPQLLVHRQVSALALDALMWFYRPRVDGSLDTMANTWLSNQLGKCLRLPLARDNVIGACQWRWDEALQKIKMIITEVVNNHLVLDEPTSIWISQFGLMVVQLRNKDNRFIGRLLAALAQSPERLRSLPTVCAFLEAVSLEWKNGQLSLVPESKFHLWICHPPSLEWEVLQLLETSAENPLTCVSQNWEDSDLEKACHSSARIFSCVTRIICSLVVKASFHPLVLELLYIVQQTVQQCSRDVVLEAFPAYLHSAIVLLQVNPNGVPQTDIPMHLNCIFNALQPNTKGRPTNMDVILLLLLFPLWFSVALAQIATSTTDQVANRLALRIQAILPNVKNTCLNQAVALVREVHSLSEQQAVDHIITATPFSCCRGLALAMLLLLRTVTASPVAPVMPSTCLQLLAWCQLQLTSHKS